MRTEWIEPIEVVLIGTIVAIQLLVFARTFRQIGIYRLIVPHLPGIKLRRLKVPLAHLETKEPLEILQQIDVYSAPPKEVVALAEIAVIDAEAPVNEIFGKILFSLNTYLIRNRGGASDFNLIKDIVERNTDAVEEDIHLTISIPVYLGLMGTMLGIVIGLFNMANLSGGIGNKLTDEHLGQSISILLSGVKIAMISSFSGLLLTMVNSGWIFKGTKSFVETRKNDLYTFIQTELLPVINQSLAATLSSLQRNLLFFNSEFKQNLEGLSIIFDKSHETMVFQKEMFDSLDSARIGEIANYNLKIFNAFTESSRKLEKFGTYIDRLNAFVAHSENLTTVAQDLLVRTDNFRVIAVNLGEEFSLNRKLMEFLSTHFARLDEHKKYVEQNLAETGHSMSDIFRELKDHIQRSSDHVKKFTIDEMEALRGALSETKNKLGLLDKLALLDKLGLLDKLDWLEHLERLSRLDDLYTGLNEFKNSEALQVTVLKQDMQFFHRQMDDLATILRNIEKRQQPEPLQKPTRRRKWLVFLKKLFTRKAAANEKKGQ